MQNKGGEELNLESEKRKISKADSDESIVSYLGETNLKYLKSISTKIWQKDL